MNSDAANCPEVKEKDPQLPLSLFEYEGKCEMTTSVASSSWEKRTKWTCCQITLIVLGLLTAASGVALLTTFPLIFDSILHKQMEVVPGSMSFNLWEYTPVPLFLRFYLFNITNPKEFKAGDKPVLEEIGPYVYREYHQKRNITFHDNYTVEFFQQRWWVWDQEASGNHTQEDVITILNTVPVSAMWAVRKIPTLPFIMNKFFNEVGEELILNATVREIIFEGFTDPVLNFTQSIMVNGSLPSLPPFFPSIPPGLTDYDKFAWFYKRNLSLAYDGHFNMYTGHDTLDHVGVIDNWNGANTTEFFDEPCNVIYGSAGELWPPNQQPDAISLYSPDLCMTMTLYYQEETVDGNGLPGYRYWGTNETLPGDGCYCVKDVCAPYGLVNSETCRMGAPAFVSFPHFLNADPTLLDAVVGLSPDPNTHGFVLDMIPEPSKNPP